LSNIHHSNNIIIPQNYPKIVEPANKKRRLNTSLSVLVDKNEVEENRNNVQSNNLHHYMSMSFSQNELFEFNNNPLEFWKLHEKHMPILSQIAKSIFAVQASIAPSERIFSQSGEIMEDKRTNLNTDKVSSMLFLNSVKNYID